MDIDIFAAWKGQTEEEETRLFFVVDSVEVNEEIFETLHEARRYGLTVPDSRIRIALVENAYREEDGHWNYDDFLNTFEFIKEIK